MERKRMTTELSDDLIWGAEAIAETLNQKLRPIYYQLENGLIPAGKIGEKWVASRQGLKEHFKKITSGTKKSA
jgi:hypothetical protein